MNSFDLIAWIYENASPGNYLNQADLVINIVKPTNNQIILDLGGGTGTLGNILTQKTGAHVVVLENSSGMLSIGQKKNHLVELRKEDITHRFSFNDQTIDIVLMIFTLHHIKPEFHRSVLSEIKRVIKADGKVLFIEMDKHNFWSTFRLVTEKIMTVGQVWFDRPEKLIKDMERLNFTVTTKPLTEGYLLFGKLQ